ncbi:MAG: DNRLRE domain-containing protein [Planctomycetales bacterium]|nr:DNRLRE domain-containing protein [Planctomycetales bacterium]
MLGTHSGSPLAPVLLLAVILAASSSSRCCAVVVLAAKDNNIYEDGLGGVNESNGRGDFLHAGTNGQGQMVRALLAFDLSGVPENAQITSVQLTLTESTPNSHAGTVNLHRVLADWGEGNSDAPSGEAQGTPATVGDATWTHRFFSTETWTNAGGDFVAEASASRIIPVDGISFPTWSSPQMVSDVQSWVDDPGSNFGWLLRLEDEASSAIQFHSRDNTESPQPPILEIEFDTPAGLPGDYNGDDVVDAADYTLWRDNLGGPADSLLNNADGEPIGAAHYATWRTAYGTTISLPIVYPAPEPAALCSLALALGIAFPVRRLRDA